MKYTTGKGIEDCYRKLTDAEKADIKKKIQKKAYMNKTADKIPEGLDLPDRWGNTKADYEASKKAQKSKRSK